MRSIKVFVTIFALLISSLLLLAAGTLTVRYALDLYDEQTECMDETISAYTYEDIVHWELSSNRVFSETGEFDHTFDNFRKAKAFFEMQTSLDADVQ